MNSFTLRWKRPGDRFWRKIKNCTGIDARQDLDRLFLYFSDGSIHEIGTWSECESRLGPDWVIWQKINLSKEIGQPVQTNF